MKDTDPIIWAQYNIISSEKTWVPNNVTHTGKVRPTLYLIFWNLVIVTNSTATNSTMKVNFL